MQWHHAFVDTDTTLEITPRFNTQWITDQVPKLCVTQRAVEQTEGKNS